MRRAHRMDGRIQPPAPEAARGIGPAEGETWIPAHVLTDRRDDAPADPVPDSAGAWPALRRSTPQRTIRRAILDPAFEDEVFEIESEKRRARLADSAGRIGPDDPRRAALSAHLTELQTSGQPGIPAVLQRGQQERQEAAGAGAAAAANPHRALNLRMHLGSPSWALPQAGADATAEAAGLGAQRHRVSTALSPENKPAWERTLAKRGRMGAGIPGFAADGQVPTLGQGGDIQGSVKNRAEEEANAEREVTARQKEAAVIAILEEGRRYLGTDSESHEIKQFDAALAARDWVAARDWLTSIEAIAKDAIARTKEKLTARKADIGKVSNFKSHYKPAGYKAAGEQLMADLGKRLWLTVPRELKVVLQMVDLALDFDNRFAKIQADVAELTKAPEAAPTRRGQRKSAAEIEEEKRQQTRREARTQNLTKALELHEKMDWDQVVESHRNSSTEGSLAWLEARVAKYRRDDSLEAANKKLSEEAAKKAQEEADKAKAEAAEKAKKEKELRDKGLIGRNGTEIAETKPEDLTEAGEKDAVTTALDCLDKGTVPVLTHPNGMKWGAPFGNRDGDLPTGSYTEYYVQKAPDSTTYHGNRRLVKEAGSGRIYYTATHYGENGSPAFVRVK